MVYGLFEKRRRVVRQIALAGVSAAALSSPAMTATASAAQGVVETQCAAVATTCAVGDTVIYMPGFFTQYNPITALDMVARVPGFSIDSGDNVRGFGGAAGNVLIDGQRPSTKSANIFDTLGRIGAGNVERIELIRGGTGSLDVGGQSVVVNVVRKADAGSNPSPWELRLVKRRPDGGFRPQGEISYSGQARGVDFTVGANAYGISLKFGGEEEITRFFGDNETRQRDGVFREQGGGVNLKLEKPFDNGDTARFSVEAGYFRLREDFDETRFLASGGPDFALFTFPLDNFQYEIGGDYEHGFTDNFGVKLIGLFKREDEEFESGFQFQPAAGAGDRSIFASDSQIGETIGRIEFDWKAWNKHAVQFGGEIAHNFIESAAQLLVDDGAGGLTPVDIAGANTRVSEIRGEPFITDSWSLTPKLKVDAGFKFEFSRISQKGDNANSRFFTYPKPSLALTYNVAPKTQLRFAAERTVNQLSFGQFVSSVNFDDEDVDFGNPDLQPQRAWELEAAFEQRFGEIGVFELTGFYQFVSDVEDLLPIGGIVEVPGNIGDGEVWGGRAELTLPLDAVMLKNARLELSGTVQDSSVPDPVTGLDRRFSFQTPYRFEVEYRQDFPAQKFSWGWEISKNGDEEGFGLDEVTRFSFRKPEFDAFIETTMIKGVKARLSANDILNVNVERDRTVFDGSRALGAPLFREVRGNQNGGGLVLTLSGTF